jgi:alpha-N-arabinofuranosidase
MYRYQNPVIPGFNPDPSVCRDGDDYYLVTSTFEFFPGVPIYHSKNLVNWELIGHCLHRNEQVPLEGCGASGGIYAPTLRKQGKYFYMTTTNVSSGGNFIVHAEDIRGPWSNPVYIDQGGIDPSLLFINDTVYFCSNGGEGDQQGICVCEIDPLSGKKVTPSTWISSGCGGKNAEAPHLYYSNNWYYLMLAEGGTEYGHMVTIQRSRDIYGPYEPCPHNPILSHKDRNHPIQATGHADIFEDHRGKWWMVCLGIRPLGWTMLHNLGRETFLAPVTWQDGWPVVGNNGTLELTMEAPLPAPPGPVNVDFTDDFSASPPALNWTYIRNPDTAQYQRGGGLLRIEGTGRFLSTPDTNPSFVGIRQQSFAIEAVTTIRKNLKPGVWAGISAYYNHDYHYDLGLECDAGGNHVVILNKRLHDLEQITFRQTIAASAETVDLRITTDRRQYRFWYRIGQGAWVECGAGLTAGLCTEGTHTMTFTGVFIGLFAAGGPAEFTGFTVHNKPE